MPGRYRPSADQFDRGIFGLFDVASELGLEKHEEDFGQTMAVWGVGDGGYLFWPVIGPRTLRDTAAGLSILT
jgi:phospholipid-binding lipoprotein MlaA